MADLVSNQAGSRLRCLFSTLAPTLHNHFDATSRSHRHTATARLHWTIIGHGTPDARPNGRQPSTTIVTPPAGVIVTPRRTGFTGRLSARASSKRDRTVASTSFI